VALAYTSSLDGAFVLDDIPAIVENPHIRSLTPLAHALAAPPGTTVSGRPIVSLTLAVNYALSPAAPGTAPDVRGYHLLNLTIHVLAGLALFGAARRTFVTAPLADRFGPAATPLAGSIALLWLLHPLQTAAVTYVVQRAESLMGLFLLLTLYCAIRADGGARGWRIGAVAACALGMGTKEVMVAAPLVVLAWDWLFAARGEGGFGAVWARRRGLYAGLAATWLILAVIVSSGPRTGSVGFGFEGWPWWRYLATQAGVILYYLRLSIVPSPLVLDYGWPAAPSLADALPELAAVATLLVATIFALARRHAAAFAGALFFLVLAPTSSVLPIATEVAAEHRMYLPLAAIVSLAVAGAFVAGRRAAVPRSAGFFAVAVVAAILGSLTHARNEDYSSEERIWLDTIRKRPSNPRARVNYSVVLLARGHATDAEPHLRAALAVDPDDEDAHLALGAALCSTGRCGEGLTHLQRAAELDPDDPNAVRNLAEAHAAEGQRREAAAYFRRAVELLPEDVFVLNQASWLLATAPEDDVRDGTAALAMAERAVRLTGGRDPVSLDSLAVAYAELGRLEEAREAIRKALAAAQAVGPQQLEGQLRQHLMAIEAGQRIR
jgi:Flp pilus assembly protein TadD